MLAAALSGQLLAGLADRWFELELRRASAASAAVLLRAAGFAVTRSDTDLVTPTARFPVLLPCAGGRFLAATLVVGFVAVAIGAASRRRRALLAVLLLPLAVGGNALRVATLVAAGPDHAALLHSATGYASFALVVLAIIAGAGVTAPAHSAGPPTPG